VFEIKYQEHLIMELDNNNEIQSIQCDLPLIAEGMDRKVYQLSSGKVLKVAKTMTASLINWHEINIYKNIKDKDCVIHFPKIYEYDENGLWYVYEKINMSSKAMTEVLKIVPCLDCSDNAGYNKDGKLTIVDADRLHWTWFVRETNPYAKCV